MYFLNHDNSGRLQHMNNITSNFSSSERIGPPEPDGTISKLQSGALGYIRMIERGLADQDRSKPFQPFLCLEDDVSFFSDEFKQPFEIPGDADIVNVGLSTWGLRGGTGVEGATQLTVYNNLPSVCRCLNMLSTHSMLICSAKGANTLTTALVNDFCKNRHYDMSFASIQKHLNVYVLRKPLFYQDSVVGGQECATRIEVVNQMLHHGAMHEPNNDACVCLLRMG